ncbi:MAG: efflux RND transporter periplasmic adaptor subunit [Bacteroidales bacterium]|jgi:HlyD family secretion protein|nr:efflux RND transporter periplasmic adaptor subunit [Bacteroidales bacterium]MDI9576338.1 efflux RND transporter periplasmic adaptor subunit [Bacteroidota bacterium]MDD2593632.1 efflux RND transporter periplasmic adaptor subunit [Bacteroidales bacterium]MDY0401676.1 efflux RND transporter periplasmic adaptor subunit [Bacteroidales bacterium]HHW58734.1 efflux RND transporter periplasmic adaptor subunit [Bacteroidales bacterium]
MKNNKKTKRILIISGVSLLVLVIILRAIGVIGGSNGLEVAVEKTIRRNITETITASGKIQPVKEVKISPDVSGEIIEILVKEGDKVKAGQVLAKINTDIYKATYEQASAQLQAQKANLANTEARLKQTEAQLLNAQLNFNRQKQLYEKGAISSSEYETAETNYKVAKAEYEAAKQSVKAAEFTVASVEASMDEALKNLNRTTIIAPLSGVVTKLSVEVGERVAGASQFSPGTEVIRIADMNELEIVVTVNELEIVRIHQNDTANITLDAYDDYTFKGIVTDMAISTINTLSLTSADEVSTYEVKIRLLPSSYQNLLTNTETPYPFRPGMSAYVEIITKKAFNVIAVPIAAVTVKTDTATMKLNEVVFVVNKDNKVEKRNVKTGIQDNQYIEIIDGIKENENVVIAPYSLITNILKGDESVTIVSKSKLYQK